MTESEKTFSDKCNNNFFFRFMEGNGLDVGFKGYQNSLPILGTATGIDIGYPGYDGIHLPFEDKSQDYVYSSHTLEHIDDYKSVIKEWYRVTKSNGYVVIVVPHRDLYEKKLELPSIFNQDHKRFYTPASLMREVEESLPINSFRVRHMQDNDHGHDYNQPSTEHSKWCYEIELVIERL